MRLKSLLVGLALSVTSLFGCQPNCILPHQVDLTDPSGRLLPSDSVGELDNLATRAAAPPPMTVDETDRESRFMSLREAIAIALENGTIGVQSPTTPGLANDSLGGFAGTTIQSSDAIRVLAIDPAIVTNNIELSLSRFDAQWATSLLFNRTETPNGLSATSPFLPNVFRSSSSTDDLTYRTGLLKPLPTGGLAGITFALDSAWNRPPGVVNPEVQPSLKFIFEQPLLQGAGVEINQLRDTHPGSILNPLNTTFPVEGILITRIRSNEQRAEFERNVNFLLLNVEAAYWNHYGAYCQLYVREDAMRYAFESWRLTKLLFEANRVAEQDVAQTRVQYEQFRSQRLTALGQVLESERQLRGLLGLKIEDGTRIVPTDTPTLVPFQPNWHAALTSCLARRPELALAREEVKVRQLDLIRQRNNLLPDLRFVATSTAHSLGSRIDAGPVPQNPLHNLATNPFNDLQVGLVMNMPVGMRAAHVTVQNAKINLKRSYLNLRTEEDKAERFLGLAYRQVIEFQRQIQINQAGLRAATIQLERKFDVIREGRAPAYGADLILAEQNWAALASGFYAAIIQYNNALTTLDFAQGAIMERDSVYIGEGPLPQCVQVRAVEHERERTRAVVLSQRGSCAASCPNTNGECKENGNLPHMPFDTALPVPTLIQSRLGLPEPSDDLGSTVVGPSSLSPTNSPQVPKERQLNRTGVRP